MSLRATLRKTFIKTWLNKYRYLKSDFAKFERSFHPETRKLSAETLQWANRTVAKKSEWESPKAFDSSSDPLIRRSIELKKELEKQFKGKHDSSELRVLVHVPNVHRSPAGYSIFINLLEAAGYMGYQARALSWEEDTKAALEEFNPNVLLSSDSEKWLCHIDWDAVSEYRKENQLKLGLTASLEEEYNTPLEPRLEKNASERGVDFYYFYDSEEYLEERRDAYQPFFDRGYDIFTYEYTLNPLKYYPVPGLERDIDYVFIGSGYGHRSKMDLYRKYFSGIWTKYSGVIYGPGWKGIPYQGINNERDRYLYSRGKIGLNLSITRQMKWSSVLNERTYMLAACGIPQLTDRPLILDKRFSDEELFIAETPEDYDDLFAYILSHPEEAQKRALRSMDRVYREHTNFHRCESFFDDIEKLFTEEI